MRTVSNYFDAGRNYPAFMFHWIELLLSPPSPPFCAVGVLLEIWLLLPSLSSFSPHIKYSAAFVPVVRTRAICHVGKGSTESCSEYFMVISCDRGGGGEQQRVSILEEEEVMVLWHLDSLTQTVTRSNGSDRGTERVGQTCHGSCRDWSPGKTPAAPPIYCSRVLMLGNYKVYV